MKEKLEYILLFTILNLLIACDYNDARLEITNLSKNDIAVETYLDSIPEPNGNMTEFYLRDMIASGETRRMIEVGSTQGWDFNIKNSKNNRLNLFVFQIDSLKKYGIDTLITKGIYDRYIFSKEKLDDEGWKISIE